MNKDINVVSFSVLQKIGLLCYFVGSINFDPQVAYPNIFNGQRSIVQQVKQFLWSYQNLLLEV